LVIPIPPLKKQNKSVLQTTSNLVARPELILLSTTSLSGYLLCSMFLDKITPDSAEKFVKKLITAGHLAMVEHSNFVVRRLDSSLDNMQQLRDISGKYLNVVHDGWHTCIGGNLTAWFQRGKQLGWNDPIFNLFRQLYAELFFPETPFLIFPENEWQVCPHNEIPPAIHRYSAKFICDRGVSHELVRHRPCSFAQESTRYVNYVGKDMKFIEPTGFENWTEEQQRGIFVYSCATAESAYNIMLEEGFSPQQARAVLPNALKTEIVVTADAAEWKHIRSLRTSKAAHPDMQRVMNMMPWEEFL